MEKKYVIQLCKLCRFHYLHQKCIVTLTMEQFIHINVNTLRITHACMFCFRKYCDFIILENFVYYQAFKMKKNSTYIIYIIFKTK